MTQQPSDKRTQKRTLLMMVKQLLPLHLVSSRLPCSVEVLPRVVTMVVARGTRIQISLGSAWWPRWHRRGQWREAQRSIECSFRGGFRRPNRRVEYPGRDARFARKMLPWTKPFVWPMALQRALSLPYSPEATASACDAHTGNMCRG